MMRILCPPIFRSLCAALLALGLTAAPVQAQTPQYVKVSNAGVALPASAMLGSGPNDWACTYDSQNGLIWEVKTTSGLRSQSHTYSWYDSNSTDGNLGVPDNGTCETSGRCDTEKYAQDVNTAGLCGASDWRMPTIHELEALVNTGYATTIDPDYFPYTSNTIFWSGSPTGGDPTRAQFVNFAIGNTFNLGRNSPQRVRLVRTGQPLAAPLSPAVTSIPTLSQWATLALAGLLGLTSLAAMRRRNPRG